MHHEENATILNIKTRRSVRDYHDTQLSDEMINRIIDAGTYAPSALDIEPWRFVIVQNRELLNEISDFAKPLLVKNLEKRNDELAMNIIEIFKNESFDIFYNAPVMIIVIGSKDNAYTDYDCSLCAENMMLAAHSMGIGSCWIGAAALVEESAELMAELKIPEDHKIVAPMIFGYPKITPDASLKTEPVLIWLK